MKYRYTICDDLRKMSEKALHLVRRANDMPAGQLDRIKLHPRKTYYAPISRGFTFCGWHYSLEHGGKIHVRIKNTKKKEMEHCLNMKHQYPIPPIDGKKQKKEENKYESKS